MKATFTTTLSHHIISLFSDKGHEVQKSQVICPRSHSWQMGESEAIAHSTLQSPGCCFMGERPKNSTCYHHLFGQNCTKQSTDTNCRKNFPVYPFELRETIAAKLQVRIFHQKATLLAAQGAGSYVKSLINTLTQILLQYEKQYLKHRVQSQTTWFQTQFQHLQGKWL